MIGMLLTIVMLITGMISYKHGTVDPIIIAGMFVSSAIFYLGFYVGLTSTKLGDICDAIRESGRNVIRSERESSREAAGLFEKADESKR